MRWSNCVGTETLLASVDVLLLKNCGNGTSWAELTYFVLSLDWISYWTRSYQHFWRIFKHKSNSSMNWTHLWHRKGAIEHGEWKVMKFWYRKWTGGLIWFLRIVEDASLTQFGSVLWRLCFWRAISLITVRFARYLLRQQRAGHQLLSLLRWLWWCGCCVMMSVYDISCVAVVVVVWHVWDCTECVVWSLSIPACQEDLCHCSH